MFRFALKKLAFSFGNFLNESGVGEKKKILEKYNLISQKVENIEKFGNTNM